MTIDDSVFKTVPEVTATQFVDYDALQVVWTDAVVTTAVLGPAECGPLAHIITQTSGLALDLAVFTTSDLSMPEKVLSIQTGDLAQVGVHNLKLTVFYLEYMHMYAVKEFAVDIVAECVPTSVTKTTVFSPSQLTYTVGDPSFVSSEL